MDDIIGDLGDFIFSLFISYIGAMELLFVVRHLCHNAGRHPVHQTETDDKDLKEFQEKMRQQLAKATEKEDQSGTNVMQDGVLYKDGFRLDPHQAEIEKLKSEIDLKEAKEKRRAEIEAELARQRKIEEETRKQLEEAEAELERQRAEEKQNRIAAEEAESLRKMLEAEKEREAQQRKLEEEEGAELEKQRNLAKEEEEENDRELLAAEAQHEEDQRQIEEGEAKGEHRDERESRRFLDVERLHDLENSEDEIDLRFTKQLSREGSTESRKRLIEENARKFLEAEQEMVALQQKILESTPTIEEEFTKRSHTPSESARSRNELMTPTVKTQFGQSSSESFVVTTKPLLFPGISDDASSNEPFSSKQSSLSTQPSEEITTTGTEDASKTTIALQIPQHERQEPDGEDNAPPVQYSEDYLRSLDGIKSRPLMREDGSGRRRAFKKRRSSGSSNSSRDSRASREEELKMFTSLEEEELQNTQKGDSDFTPIKYTNEPTLKVKSHHHRRHKRSPAKDSKAEEQVRSSLEMLGEEGSNPWGEVVPEHYKDMDFWKREKAMSIDEEEIELDLPKTRVETTSESATNKPSSSSFEEASHEQNEEAISALQKQLSKDPEPEGKSETSADLPDNSQSTSENRSNLITSPETESKASPARSSSSPRLRRSPRIDEMDQYEDRWIESEIAAKNQIQPISPLTPIISINSSEDMSSWRDEHGLILEGISDFYDFTASVNPSRSRPTSRNASPVSSVPNTPLFGGVSNFVQRDAATSGNVATSTKRNFNETPGNFVDCKIEQDIIPTFIEPSLDEQISEENFETNIEIAHAVQKMQSSKLEEEESIPVINIVNECSNENVCENESVSREEMNTLVQTLRAQRAASRSRSRSPLPTSENLARSLESRRSKMIKHNDEVFEKLTGEIRSHNESSESCKKEEHEEVIAYNHPNEGNEGSQIQTLETERTFSRSRSRSISPLPTSENLAHSIENRRAKLIKYNDELFEKLAEDTKSHKTVLEPQYCKETDLENNKTAENTQNDQHNQQSNTQEEMVSLLHTIRAERVASRSRSRSPFPSTENLTRSLEIRRTKMIKHNDELFEKLTEKPLSLIEISEPVGSGKHLESPMITVESVENSVTVELEDSKEDVSSLVASLRVDRVRSRSRSKSPMRIPTAQNLEDSIHKRREKLIERNDQLSAELHERSKSPQPSRVIVQYVYEFEESAEGVEIPSLTQFSDYQSQSPQYDINIEDEENFHRMLNLESSQNRTLIKNSEELESIMAEKQRDVDEEALFKLKTANEEIELRTLTPTELWRDLEMEIGNRESNATESEGNDLLSDLPMKERLQKLRCSPTTPEYDRSVSEECRDVQRIKNEILTSGFKRSTYVGESMDVDNEYEGLRREAAFFRRSNSPSPSFEEPTMENTARQSAAERRRIQDSILSELISCSTGEAVKDEEKYGAKPKLDYSSSEEYPRSFSKEAQNTQRMKEELLNSGFKRSTYVGESVDISAQYDEMRREMLEFRRSRSCSRSPVDEQAAAELLPIDVEVAKRAMQDEMLDKISGSGVSFQDFSRHLKADFLDDRRASDSAVIPDFKMQYRESHHDYDIEPEEYHHYRRFSLNQEQPTEEYPNDEFVYVSQVEVHTLTGTRTWTREDYYSAELADLRMNLDREEGSEAIERAEQNQVDLEIVRDEEESDGSEDERQTVVEVDDEIDTDICDFNERGPTDESHHEQSECEEAERAMDHYANREATDWQEVADVSDILSNNEASNDEDGAIGGTDTDSFTIDQIYGEAIKNRKQSGILREYDSILQEMQTNCEHNDDQDEINEINEKDRYTLWAKTRSGKTCSVSFAESERHDTEIRYLGDANMTARQSTRLRSRYGFVPQLQNNSTENLDVDLNYKPKREYNWRKNFKLDDEVESNEIVDGADFVSRESFEEDDLFDERKYSLGGESITLFSRSPDREIIDLTIKETEVKIQDTLSADILPESMNGGDKENSALAKEKPKKKKSKKKALREAKEMIERRLSKEEEEDSDCQMYSRRSSSIQMETDSSKRKSRSRRSSRSSITTDDSCALFSPRSSVGFIVDTTINSNNGETAIEVGSEPIKKKIKKRKKVKDSFAVSQDIKEEQEQPNDPIVMLKPISTMATIATISTTTAATISTTSIASDSASLNMLSVLSPENSIYVKSTSIESEFKSNPSKQVAVTTTTTMTTTPSPAAASDRATAAPLETFDILKDANFYPLF